MNNPLRILQSIDAKLDHPVELFLYGRAALVLGFENPPSAAAATNDVDGIIPRDQLDAFDRDENWWAALASANEELEPQGLYLTHLFSEEQIILRSNWRDHAVSIVAPLGLRFLRLKRPATIDLILTKMMRGTDPQDMEDVRFYLQREPAISVEELSRAFALATGPDIQEIWQGFAAAKPVVLALAQGT